VLFSSTGPELICFLGTTKPPSSRQAHQTLRQPHLSRAACGRLTVPSPTCDTPWPGPHQSMPRRSSRPATRAVKSTAPIPMPLKYSTRSSPLRPGERPSESRAPPPRPLPSRTRRTPRAANLATVHAPPCLPLTCALLTLCTPGTPRPTSAATPPPASHWAFTTQATPTWADATWWRPTMRRTRAWWRGTSQS
jgi:hypothetical protein